MPEMEINTTDEILDKCAKIYCYMLYPNDAISRNLRRLAGEAEGYLRMPESKDSTEITIPLSYLKKLIQAPSLKEELKKADELTRKGAIAGRIFLFMLEMGLTEDIEPSLSKARFLTYHYFQHATDGSGAKLERVSSDSKLKKVWTHFRDVAYLWAGHQLAKESLSDVVIQTLKENGSFAVRAVQYANALLPKLDQVPNTQSLRTKHCKDLIGLTDSSWLTPECLQCQPEIKLGFRGLSNENRYLLEEKYKTDWDKDSKSKQPIR